MTRWLRGLVLALVFALVGAFTASLWLELLRETPAAVESRPPDTQWEGHAIRVEVLNGAGIPEIAEQATEGLRKLGFDVVYWGNIEGFGHDTSEVIARLGAVEPARRVADVLQIRWVTNHPDRNLYLDVTVILGTDWARREAAAATHEPGGAERWWDRVKRAAGRLWPG